MSARVFFAQRGGSGRLLLAALAALAAAFAFAVAGCDDCRRSSAEAGDGGSGGGSGGSLADGGVKLVFVYGSEKESWMKTELAAFEASGAKTASGEPIHVEAHAMGSGEALQAIVDGKLKAHVFSPASSLYDKLLDDAWSKKSGTTRKLAGAGEPLVLSPVVIAMWRPMAEALGWPNKHAVVERSP